MKRINVFFGIVLALPVTFCSESRASLIGLYQFNDAGNLGLDTSGNGNHATATGGPGFTASGFQDGGLSLDGTNFLRSPIDVNPGVLPQMTWGAWANPSLTNFVRQVLSSDNAGFDRGLHIDSRIGGDWATFHGGGIFDSGIAPSSGVFTFVAGVYDQGAGSMTFYVDGSSFAISTSFGGSHPFFDIGHNPSFGEFFVGTIDNVFVYDTALTPAEINTIRLNGFPAAAAVPEPSSFMLMIFGAFGVVVFYRRHRQNA